MTTATPRETYRHGDLRQALLTAGIEMAREGGPDAVILREATRRSGVSPNAAYRHFADRQALLSAVSDAAQAIAADAMAGTIASVGDSSSPIEAARQGLRAVGVAYIQFARKEPGLFRAAFSVPSDLSQANSAAKAGTAGLTPFQLLGRALDRLVESGALPTERRENAELFAWSAVHGLGMLVIDGPLRGLNDALVDQATERLIDMVERGL